jgi:hypothetical protein
LHFIKKGEVPDFVEFLAHVDERAELGAKMRFAT